MAFFGKGGGTGIGNVFLSQKKGLQRVFSYWFGWGVWEKESVRRPAPVRNSSLPEKMGDTEERFRW